MALAVLAGVLGLALLTGDRSSAQTSAELEDVRAEQDDVRDRLAEQNAAIDALIGEVSALRVQEDKVAAELAEQEAKLAAERAELADARAFLAATRRKLDRSLVELEDLLVSIYRYGQPDMATVLLESDGIDQLSRTKTYLDSIRDYETGVVVRVRDLRVAAADTVTEIEATVERMEVARQAIAERQQELAASRADLEEREAALQAAQDERREQLSELQGDERDLVRALIAPGPGARTGGRRFGARAGRRARSASAGGRRRRARSGPERDRRRRLDLRYALPVGRRARLVRVLRLRLLGRGQLRLARRRIPLHATRLDRLHDLGRARTG